MIDTRNPSWHLDVFQTHGTGPSYWENLSAVVPPYDLSSEHETSLAFFSDEKLFEQLVHNKNNFWYLDPYTGEIKDEVKEAIGNGVFDNSLIKEYYKDGSAEVMYPSIYEYDKQTSYKFKLWEDPVYSEYFMTFMPFSGTHLRKFFDELATGTNFIARDSTGIEMRGDTKPSLIDLEQYCDGYHFEGREWNRFFFPSFNSESGQPLTEE